MAAKFGWSDLTAAIESTYDDIARESENGEVRNMDVLKRLNSSRSHLIAAFTPQLLERALTKLLNDVSTKKAKNRSADQTVELFPGFPDVPTNISTGRGRRKSIGMMTISECLTLFDKQSSRVSEVKHKDFEPLVLYCKGNSHSNDETISDIWSRSSPSESAQQNRLF